MMPVMGERDGMGLGHEILMEDGAGTGKSGLCQVLYVIFDEVEA